jgi:hypothetical protein
MAIVQISKIQVRRGQKYSNTGVPQLSSGEFAWAVDSQELYIGNGSIAEGAPYVGNTKILTEHDNLIELLGSYQFAIDTPSISGTVSRSLQTKLDESVSVLDFGPAEMADGVIDCTTFFQTAIDQLFLNVDATFKRRLRIPPGRYKFNSDLFLPSTAFLEGENRVTVILDFGSNDVRFKSALETLEGDFTSADHPEDIKLSNLTLEFTTGQFVLSGVTDSTFELMKFKSNYVLGNDISAAIPTLLWENDLPGASASRNTFRRSQFEFLPIVAKCVQTLAFETAMTFDTCEFSTCGQGINVDGVTGQSNKWLIFNCDFNEIARQAFVSPFGVDTQVIQCRFRNCGNDTNSAADPTTFVIQFGEGNTNIVKSCSFDRLKAAGVTSSFDKFAIQEVYGGGLVEISDRVGTDIFLSNAARPLAVFSLFNSSTTIDYTLVLGPYVRKGTLTIGVEKDRSNFSITDNYQLGTESNVMNGFEFGGVMRNNNSNDLVSELADSTVDTLILTYTNPNATGAAGTISYSVTYSV